MKKSNLPCVLYVGTFPPRECGIATFTQDLTNAMDKGFNSALKSRILAMNASSTAIYNYSKKIIMQINQDEIEDYLLRAREINKLHNIRLVNIQHEYGIFGGESGNYLLPFMEMVKKPIITTFHTILPAPDKKLKRITQAIIDRSSSVVVMTQSAAEILKQIYGAKKSKICVIPHGVHHVAFPSKSKAKRKLNLQGKTILSTFGMINRDKGIEYAIKALPEVVKKYPDVLYLILGATHPLVRKYEGERYRDSLKKIISQLKLENYVKFYDKYLTLDELIEFLKATDIYISPTLNPLQAVSGTLSYALSCACPIISTATQYAKDTINPERGILVRFKNHKDIERALLLLLQDKKARKEMKKNAYLHSRHMTWQNVALSYFKAFNNFAKIVPRKKGKLPPVNLGHIKTLTDKFGIIQFANHTKPDLNSGYCLDDNSRALLASSMLYQEKPTKGLLDLITIYLKFIKFTQKSSGQFISFISRHKTAINQPLSEDSFGRSIGALSYLFNVGNLPDSLKKQTFAIFRKAEKNIAKIQSPRAIAFTIIGLVYALEPTSFLKSSGGAYAKENEANSNQLKKLAGKLVKKYKQQIARPKNIAKKWFWFEDYLTYSNYKLPESLFHAFKATGDREYLKVAEDALKFLISINFEKDYFSAIGQNGWYFRDGKRAYFDQQPEDTSSAVEALVKAYEITKNKDYAEKAKIAFDWFLGKNYLSQMVYDEATGGCYDGLGKYSLNFNQGAESTISYLLARLAIGRTKLFK